jgi:predicted Zn-dependent peptidase
VVEKIPSVALRDGKCCIRCDAPPRIAMVLLNNIIGGQAMNSRLNMALRERKGMAYNIESGYTAYTDTGLFNVYFGTDHENLEKAIGPCFKEFKLLREKKLGVLQLSKAQKQLDGANCHFNRKPGRFDADHREKLPAV